MNFTREPIIETIITPKEGFKLLIKNSKNGGSEEYSVDAVEVVSFGHSFFYRSLERPKSFLLPITDYEVIEAKETRVVLKNVPLEKSIKIGGGKNKNNKEESSNEDAAKSDEKPKRKKPLKRRRPSETKEGSTQEIKGSETKDSSNEEKSEEVAKETKNVSNQIKDGESENSKNQPVSSNMFRALLPPPTELIKPSGFPKAKPKVEEQSSDFLSEDPSNKPDVEVEAESVASDPVQDEASEVSSEQQEVPKYHQAQSDEKPKQNPSEDSSVEENEDKLNKIAPPFDPENNFAF